MLLCLVHLIIIHQLPQRLHNIFIISVCFLSLILKICKFTLKINVLKFWVLFQISRPTNIPQNWFSTQNSKRTFGYQVSNKTKPVRIPHRVIPTGAISALIRLIQLLLLTYGQTKSNLFRVRPRLSSFKSLPITNWSF